MSRVAPKQTKKPETLQGDAEDRITRERQQLGGAVALLRQLHADEDTPTYWYYRIEDFLDTLEPKP